MIALSTESLVALTTIVAAGLAALASFVSLVNQKEQKTSEFRQAWIDSLRVDLAQFLGEVETLSLQTSDFMERGSPNRAEFLAQVSGQYSTLRGLLSRIILRLNPDEHHDLEVVLVELGEALHAEPIHIAVVQKLRESTLRESRSILKSEWVRVKRGEPAYQVTKVVTAAAAVLLAGLFFTCATAGA